MSWILFYKLCKRFVRVIWEGDVVLVPLASIMLCKLDEYKAKVVTEQATLARILDPQFPMITYMILTFYDVT